jgi:hypothetical protein
MDMVKDNANRIRFNYDGAPGIYEVDFSAYWHDINHIMDNYSFDRPRACAWRRRPTAATRASGWPLPDPSGAGN